ncbi:uncharacterized protein LOC144373185 [Ictidomys tridecemlineatus]
MRGGAAPPPELIPRSGDQGRSAALPRLSQRSRPSGRDAGNPGGAAGAGGAGAAGGEAGGGAGRGHAWAAPGARGELLPLRSRGCERWAPAGLRFPARSRRRRLLRSAGPGAAGGRGDVNRGPRARLDRRDVAQARGGAAEERPEALGDPEEQLLLHPSAAPRARRGGAVVSPVSFFPLPHSSTMMSCFTLSPEEWSLLSMD